MHMHMHIAHHEYIKCRHNEQRDKPLVYFQLDKVIKSRFIFFMLWLG